MSVDSLSNMLSSINNASLVRKEFIEIPCASLVESVADVLLKHGYFNEVRRFKKTGTGRKYLHITLKYTENGDPCFILIKRISTQGRRIYRGSAELYRRKKGIFVVSTSQGVMSNLEAVKKSLGGEVLFEIV